MTAIYEACRSVNPLALVTEQKESEEQYRIMGFTQLMNSMRGKNNAVRWLFNAHKSPLT
jgi:hypothetical protein